MLVSGDPIQAEEVRELVSEALSSPQSRLISDPYDAIFRHRQVGNDGAVGF